MAEKSISHLIEVTKEENRETRSVTKDMGNDISALTNMFGKYFKDLKGKELDKEEEKREKKKAVAQSPLPDLGKLMGDAGSLGIFGIIAGVTAAISGLAVGIVEGFVSAAKLILSPFGKLTLNLVKSITKAYTVLYKGIFKAVTFLPKLFLNKFFPEQMKKLQNLFTSTRKLFSSGIEKTVKKLSSLKDWAKGIAPRLTLLAKNIRTAFLGGFENISASVRNMVGRFKKMNFVEKGAKLVGALFRPFTGFFDDVKKLSGMVGGQGKQTAGFMSKIGDFFKSIKGVFGGFFTVFRTLGRVIFFPITVITTMIDAFKGFKEGFATDGIIGGVLGAISGVLQGLIGMPLDLLKNIVGWVAGKFGMEGVQEFLAGFSFTEMIGGLFNSITDSIMGLFASFKDETGKFDFGNMIGSLVTVFFNTITAPFRLMLEGLAKLAESIPVIGDNIASGIRGFKNFIRMDNDNLDSSITQRKQRRIEREQNEQQELQKTPPTSAETLKEKTTDVANAQSESLAFAPTVIAPTTNTTNNSSSTAMIGDGAPATDDLDRVA